MAEGLPLALTCPSTKPSLRKRTTLNMDKQQGRVTPSIMFSFPLLAVCVCVFVCMCVLYMHVCLCVLNIAMSVHESLQYCHAY